MTRREEINELSFLFPPSSPPLTSKPKDQKYSHSFPPLPIPRRPPPPALHPSLAPFPPSSYGRSHWQLALIMTVKNGAVTPAIPPSSIPTAWLRTFSLQWCSVCLCLPPSLCISLPFFSCLYPPLSLSLFFPFKYCAEEELKFMQAAVCLRGPGVLDVFKSSAMGGVRGENRIWAYV